VFQMVGSRGGGRIVEGKGGDRRKDLTMMARVSDLPSTTHSVQHGLSQDRSACCAVRVQGMGTSGMHEKDGLGGGAEKWAVGQDRLASSLPQEKFDDKVMPPYFFCSFPFAFPTGAIRGRDGQDAGKSSSLPGEERSPIGSRDP
jgi:hypothetical protein